MSFEKDITEIRNSLKHIELLSEQDIFKAATPEQIASRPQPTWEDRIEEIDVIRNIFEDNIGKKVTDEEWVKIVRQLLSDNPNLTFRLLENLNQDILGLLISLDDATYMAGLRIPGSAHLGTGRR